MMHAFRYMAVAALLVVPVTGQADPMGDVCHLRAKRESGYDGLRPMVGRIGEVTIRLSGSAALGMTYNSRPAFSSDTRAFAGSAARERREDKALERYLRVYDRCIGHAHKSGENSRASGAP